MIYGILRTLPSWKTCQRCGAAAENSAQASIGKVNAARFFWYNGILKAGAWRVNVGGTAGETDSFESLIPPLESILMFSGIFVF